MTHDDSRSTTTQGSDAGASRSAWARLGLTRLALVLAGGAGLVLAGTPAGGDLFGRFSHIAVGLSITAVGLAFFLSVLAWRNSALRKVEASVHLGIPGSVSAGGARTLQLASQLGSFPGAIVSNRPNVPTTFLVSADPGGVRLWSGTAAEPRCVAHLPAHAIARVDVAAIRDGMSTFAGIRVSSTVSSAHVEIPIRGRSGAGILQASPVEVDQFVEAVQARLSAD